jgi:putative transposase
MSNNIIQLNQEVVKQELSLLVTRSVEETLNALLDQEADQLTNAKRYERTSDRLDTRAGHYDRKLLTKAGEVTLKVPKLRNLTFETAIIQRYQRREISVEEALVEMYLAGVSVRRVEDITESLWGSRVSAGTISELNKKVYVHIDQWRTRPLRGKYPYVYLDGIYLKRSWGGEYRNVAVLVAMAVNEEGRREVIGSAEGMKEDKQSWLAFLKSLKERGLEGTQLFIGDKCLGLLEAISECYPDSKFQRCTVHFYRNVFTVVPRSKAKLVAAMLKAIHAQEDIASAREKAKAVAVKLREMKLPEAARKVEQGVDETLTYMHFPMEHWLKIRSNNAIERLNREIRRRTKVVGAFPDGNSALMLVCARLRYLEDKAWGNKLYLSTEHLYNPEGALDEALIG